MAYCFHNTGLPKTGGILKYHCSTPSHNCFITPQKHVAYLYGLVRRSALCFVITLVKAERRKMLSPEINDHVRCPNAHLHRRNSYAWAQELCLSLYVYDWMGSEIFQEEQPSMEAIPIAFPPTHKSNLPVTFHLCPYHLYPVLWWQAEERAVLQWISRVCGCSKVSIWWLCREGEETSSSVLEPI